MKKLVKFTPWSTTIKKRRLSWLGHLLRLDPDTPARQALEATLTPHKRKVGHPPTTWIKTINKDLKELDENLSLVSNDSISTFENLCADRKKYRGLINTVCLLEDGVDKETGDEY